MRHFEILRHTADIRLKAIADNYENLFSAALEGMNYIIKRKFDKSLSLMNFKDIVNVESIDRSMLLIDFLSEVLTLSHLYKAIYHSVNFKSFTETNLTAEVEGDKVGNFDEDIKAVTYHEAEIRKNEQGLYETIIVFDI